MKRFIFAIMLVLAIVGSATVTVSAAGPKPTQPVIVAEMPDCYMPIGGDGITLFTNVSVPDGGTMKYQWYVTDIESMAMIRAIDYAEGNSYQVPEKLGVKWYCYAAWNVVGGLESEPIYSRLIRVEFYENSSEHTHSFGEWMVTTKPTCTKAGIKTRECDCGVTERAEVPATGHNFGKWMVTTKPTCTKAGIKTRECDCGVTERAEVPAAGHNFGKWMVTTKPTCTKAGIKTRECDCGVTERAEVPAAGHNFGEWMVTTKPTCTKAGIKTRECDCGVTERAEVPAAGHNWDAGTITREPSPKADGEKTYSCLVCKATMTESVKYSESLESDVDEKNSVEPDKDRSTDLKENSENSTEQTSPAESDKVSFPWWIVAVIAAVVIGGGILAIVLIRKGRGK